MPLPRVHFTVRRMMAAVAIWAAFLALGGYWLYDNPPHDAELAALYGGAGGLAVVANPDRVEAFRLRPTPESAPRSPDAYDDLANFPTASGPVAVPAGAAATLSSSLISPRSYLWAGDLKSCGAPTPGVRLSFLPGVDRVDVLLCFRCEILLVYRGGHLTGGKDFDPIQGALARSVKALFPDDPAIQALGGSSQSTPEL